MRICLIAAVVATPLRQFTLPDGQDELAIRLDLPNGSQVSPVQLGWSGEGYSIVEFVPFEVPNGKQTTGQASYALVNGKSVETFSVEDIPEPEPPPDPIASDYRLRTWQFKAMIEVLGDQLGTNLDAAIRTAISGITDPVQRSIAKALYESSDYYERNAPVLAQIAPALGLTDEQIDAAWLTIATTEPV